MSSISRVGSIFFASSHIVCTQPCELRLASLGLVGLVATAVAEALMPTAPSPPMGEEEPSLAGTLPLPPAETAPGILTGLFLSLGLSG